jgi:hypothetical protein
LYLAHPCHGQLIFFFIGEIIVKLQFKKKKTQNHWGNFTEINKKKLFKKKENQVI